MDKVIDPFRHATLTYKGKVHGMREQSEYTLCNRSTAGENASVWETSIPEVPTCSRCYTIVQHSSREGMYDPRRRVLVYTKNRGGLSFRGAFDVSIPDYTRSRADRWGAEMAARSARLIIDPERSESFRIDVLNPETMEYETVEEDASQ